MDGRIIFAVWMWSVSGREMILDGGQSPVIINAVILFAFRGNPLSSYALGREYN